MSDGCTPPRRAYRSNVACPQLPGIPPSKASSRCARVPVTLRRTWQSLTRRLSPLDLETRRHLRECGNGEASSSVSYTRGAAPSEGPRRCRVPNRSDDVDRTEVVDEPSTDHDWMRDATCRGRSPSEFFPSDGVGVERARRMCAECPVRLECLEYALSRRIDHGVWGGCSERERRRILRRRRAQLLPA